MALTPKCPLLMQARASMMLYEVRYGPEGEANMCVAVPDRPLFPDPSMAAGIACIGSRCAWWRADGEDRTRGRCGQAETWSFPDPALAP